MVFTSPPPRHLEHSGLPHSAAASSADSEDSHLTSTRHHLHAIRATDVAVEIYQLLFSFNVRWHNLYLRIRFILSVFYAYWAFC